MLVRRNKMSRKVRKELCKDRKQFSGVKTLRTLVVPQFEE
jgi:hypothetical protein